MQDSNRILAEAHTSELREILEFERYILIRLSKVVENRGRIKTVGVPVETKYAVWGKIRTAKTYEQEKMSGNYAEGTLVFEFSMPLGTYVPKPGDYVEAHGIVDRQPRTRYLVHEIFPSSSIQIGKCIITPIGEMKHNV